jgi:hypothetical protein
MSTDPAEISVECPGCGKRFTVAAQHAGKRGKCKACGTMVTIPASSAPAAEADLYDFAPHADPAPTPRHVVAPPQTAHVAAPILSYSGPVPAKRARSAEFDPSDPFEGNKFKNLFFPLILIAGTAMFNVLCDTVWTHNAAAGTAGAFIQMFVKLLVEIPVMLIACLLAVKLLDAAFGPLGPAIIKLSAIALAPDAVSDVIVLVAFIISHASGNPVNLAVNVTLAKILGWVLSLIAYFWLFMYFFDLELGEAYRLIIFVWFVRLFFTWLVLAAVLSVVSH